MRVTVPGSSANLGPGFDVLAAALQLTLELEVVRAERFRLVTELELRRDRQNLIVRGFEALMPADGFEFHVRSEIPLSGGVGSSAAGVVAGLLAADAFLCAEGPAHARVEGPIRLDAEDRRRLLTLATEIEGHPDNAAASLFGGFVICDGTEVARLAVPEGLAAVLVVPDVGVSTASARQVLPVSVPLADAVANIAAACKLTLGLANSDLCLIAGGLRDRLHQPYRARLYPQAAALLESAAQHGALGATVSGAGPTVLVWCEAGRARTVSKLLADETRAWAQVLQVPFESHGAGVQRL